jgi:hypothetical protein
MQFEQNYEAQDIIDSRTFYPRSLCFCFNVHFYLVIETAVYNSETNSQV